MKLDREYITFTGDSEVIQHLEHFFCVFVWWSGTTPTIHTIDREHLLHTSKSIPRMRFFNLTGREVSFQKHDSEEIVIIPTVDDMLVGAEGWRAESKLEDTDRLIDGIAVGVNRGFTLSKPPQVVLDQLKDGDALIVNSVVGQAIEHLTHEDFHHLNERDREAAEVLLLRGEREREQLVACDASRFLRR